MSTILEDLSTEALLVDAALRDPSFDRGVALLWKSDLTHRFKDFTDQIRKKETRTMTRALSTKSYKAVADEVKPTGEVLAMVSPFGGQPDLQGDIVDEKAYDAAIKFWNSAGRKLPLLDSHDWSSVEADLGHVEHLEAVPGYGLVAKMKLDLSTPRGAYAHRLLKERRRVEFSIGYSADLEERQKDGSNLLKKISLKEISLVLAGAAADEGAPVGRTELLSVKTSGTKESTAARTLRNHMDSSHAQPVRAFKPPVADLIRTHRILHADGTPVSERHLTTGIPDGSTEPVTSVEDDRFRGYGTASLDRIADDVRHDARVDGYVKQARASAERDRLLDVSERVNAAKAAASAYAGMSLAEMQEAGERREDWEFQKARAEQAMRERERQEEAARLDMQAQTPEEFAALQLERAREADEALLAQPGESFTMKVGPNGELRDTS